MMQRPGFLALFKTSDGKIYWPRVVLAFGLIFGPLILLLSTISSPTPRNITLLFSILTSGLYALVLYLARDRWIPLLVRHPLRNACLLGIFNAAMVETIFWVCERLVGTTGVAASSNLLLDLIITMPWYIGMVVMFVYAQDRRRFSVSVVLLLGAVYELGADGYCGRHALWRWAYSRQVHGYYLALAYWEFIPVYASMVLPTALLVDQAKIKHLPSHPAWVYALLPLVWLIPYTIYLFILLVVMQRMYRLRISSITISSFYRSLPFRHLYPSRHPYTPSPSSRNSRLTAYTGIWRDNPDLLPSIK